MVHQQKDELSQYLNEIEQKNEIINKLEKIVNDINFKKSNTNEELESKISK